VEKEEKKKKGVPMGENVVIFIYPRKSGTHQSITGQFLFRGAGLCLNLLKNPSKIIAATLF
jgi:hypothetical protein